MSNLVLFWHRRDLRLVDNLGLVTAKRQGDRLVGVFCLDPNLLRADNVAAVRVVYLLGSLAELQQAYAQAGSQLLILKGDPVRAIPSLAKALGVKTVVWNRDVEPYAQTRDQAVAEALHLAGIQTCQEWDQLLHPPGAVRTQAGDPYTVYTPFWRNWQSQVKAEPVDLGSISGLNEVEQAQAEAIGTIPLPRAADLGFTWSGSMIIQPGTAAAQQRLQEFCDRALVDYQEQRNLPAIPGTSGLSAALKFGTIGIRTVWAATKQAMQQSRSDEAQASIRTWQQELAWREFYQQVMFYFPELADGPYREPFKNFPWQENQDHFQAWCEGRTGYPIVDAAMRQLNESGWMHNRCRMIVASFLTKDLILNWQWGEKYFMQRLIDGDLSANNGGWQWSASSGMDPKPLRVFNPASQAQKFDPEAEYIRRWLPELASLDTADLVTGKIAPLDRDRCNYPPEIVDHKQQQHRFKHLYKQQREQS